MFPAPLVPPEVPAVDELLYESGQFYEEGRNKLLERVQLTAAKQGWNYKLRELTISSSPSFRLIARGQVVWISDIESYDGIVVIWIGEDGNQGGGDHIVGVRVFKDEN